MQSSLGKFTAAGVATVGLFAGILAPRTALSQGNGTLEAPQLRDMVKAMGYELKELNAEAGKEKYEFSVEKSDLNIPIAFEVSPSKRYIWFTVYLGDVEKMKEFPARADKLIRKNVDVQPCQFYVTKKERLMFALALENRGPVDAALLRRSFEKVAEDVGASKDLWTP